MIPRVYKKMEGAFALILKDIEINNGNIGEIE